MMLFGISTLGQFQLEIPKFLPAPSSVICEEMDDTNTNFANANEMKR